MGRSDNWTNEIKRIVVTEALDRARAVPVERLLSWMTQHGCNRSTWEGRDGVEAWDFPDGCCYGVPAAGTVFSDYADRVCDLVFTLACCRGLSFWDALADLEGKDPNAVAQCCGQPPGLVRDGEKLLVMCTACARTVGGPVGTVAGAWGVLVNG